MRVYGAWIEIYHGLCSKIYGIFGGLFWSPAGSWQAARSARICETCLLETQCVTLFSQDNALDDNFYAHINVQGYLNQFDSI